MVVVHGDEMVVVIEADGLGTGGMAMAAGDVIGDDVKLWILDHVVAADPHEVVAHPIKGQIVGVTCCGAGARTTLGGTLPFCRFTRTEISQSIIIIFSVY